MIKQAWLYSIILAAVVSGQDTTLIDSIKAAIHRPPGHLLEIQIVHQQYNQNWIENATLEIIAPGRYLLDTPEQQIKVIDRELFTWNKMNDQVVIDQLSPDDISILDFLTGDFGLMEITQRHTSGRENEILFNIPANGISGSLSFNSTDYLPEKIKFDYGKDDHIVLNILKVRALPLPAGFTLFDLDGKEIIDLRE